MMHLKNIKPGNPKTEEQYLLTKNSGVVWLWTEDGKNWYEEQKNFQEDTIKIAYDENNVICDVQKDVTAIARREKVSLRFLILQQIAGLIFRVNGCSKMA
ncbi:tail fiber assembly protein [Escherichia coli]|nr:tail fiber assembly protein [Escherichia coli]